MSWFDDNGIQTAPISSAGPVATAPLDPSGVVSDPNKFGPGAVIAPFTPDPTAAHTLNSGAPTSTAPTAGVQPGPSNAASFGNLSDPSAWMGLVGNDAQLTQWVQQQNPGLSPDLVQYYVGKIKGQPGANPTEQAGSANYWAQKLQSDPTTGGAGGANPSGGPVTVGGVPGIDPSYQFRFDQGMQALQRSAASKGTLLTGGTLKAINNYGQQAASQEYGADFGRQFSLASLGENAAAAQGNNNSGYANSATNALTNNANAQGAAGIAQGNLFSGAANNIGTLYALNQMNKPPNTTGFPDPTGGFSTFY